MMRALSVKMAAEELGVHPNKIYDFIHLDQNPLEVIKIPGLSYRITTESLDRFLQCHATHNHPDCSSTKEADTGISATKIMRLQRVREIATAHKDA